MTSPQETPLDVVPVMPERDAQELLRTHAQRVAEIAGSRLERWTTVAAPCEEPDGRFVGNGFWQLSGHARIPVPPGEHLAVLHRLRERWAALGHAVGDVRAYLDGVAGGVSGTDPSDRVSISLESGDPPQWLALLALTPCYRPAPGENPFG